AQDGGAIKMSGGSITVSTTGKSTVGANFSNNSKGNELENVTISKKEGDTSSLLGISAIDNSQVTLKNVTVQQAKKAASFPRRISTNPKKKNISTTVIFIN
ncbi:hypothetical protein, partial [Bartonella taylorii]|uniref:hypothetical protein n=1 Tax=Bartonella taylorii TaxID=33046 RepID=UPI001ABB8DE5